VESHSSASSSVGSASTVFVPPWDTIPEMSDVQSTLSVSRVTRQPSLISSHHAVTVDDTAIMNQEYVYPGDRRVIPPSRHGSLRRTSSMTDLGEAFTSGLSRTRDMRPGRGLAGRPTGEDSLITVSSGSSLGASMWVTPPPSYIKEHDKTKARISGSVTTSDRDFFSAGSGETPSSFHSATSFTGPTSGTFSGLRTDETIVDFTSGGSDTQIMTSTLSQRRTDSLSILGDSHDSSTYTTTSTSLSVPRDVRRRPARTSSRSLSSSYPSYSDDSSDKENSGSYTPSGSSYTPSGTGSYTVSGTRSETTGYDVSGSSEFSSLTFPCSSVSGTTTPSRSSSSSRESIGKDEGSEVYVTASLASSDYITAVSPSSTAFESLPTIPSECGYETAEVCSTEYVTAEICPTEVSTEYTTAEICSTERSIDPENVPLPLSSPSAAATPRLSVRSISSLSSIPTIPDLVEPLSPADISLPPSTFSTESTLTHISPPSTSVTTDLTPSSSSISSEITPTPTPLPQTTLTSITESDVTSDGLTPPSPPSLPPSSPSIHLSLWAPETNESYESSVLRASPSVGSLALPEGLDTSFETSIMRPSGSVVSSLDRLTPIPETPTTLSYSVARSPSPLPQLPETISSPTSVSTHSLMPSVSSVSTLSRSSSAVSGVSSISMGSSMLDSRSLLDFPFAEPPTEPSLLSTHRASTPQRLVWIFYLSWLCRFHIYFFSELAFRNTSTQFSRAVHAVGVYEC
jgi:hypothetical protein